MILFFLLFLSMLGSIAFTFVWVDREDSEASVPQQLHPFPVCPPSWTEIGQYCVHAFDNSRNFTQTL